MPAQTRSVRPSADGCGREQSRRRDDRGAVRLEMPGGSGAALIIIQAEKGSRRGDRLSRLPAPE